jgi:hypothetical protein
MTPSEDVLMKQYQPVDYASWHARRNGVLRAGSPRRPLTRHDGLATTLVVLGLAVSGLLSLGVIAAVTIVAVRLIRQILQGG